MSKPRLTKLPLKQKARIAIPGVKATTPRSSPRIAPPKPSPLAAGPGRIPDVPMREAKNLVAQVVRLTKDLDNTFYRLGQTLTELRRPEVHRPLEYRSFSKVLATEGFPSRAHAYRAIRVASKLPEKQALAYGFDKSYFGIRYAQLVRPHMKPSVFLARDPLIRHGETRVRFSKIKAATLERILHELRRPKLPESTQKIAHRVSRSIAQKLDHRALESARVRTTVVKGKTYIEIRLELPDAEAFGESL